MPTNSYSFTHAIVRTPAQSIIDGLRAVDTGQPDFETFLSHHKDYIAALKSTGATVIELEQLETLPDSVFVEDAAGIEELRQLVSDWGYTVREVITPAGVLHFKRMVFQKPEIC